MVMDTALPWALLSLPRKSRNQALQQPLNHYVIGRRLSPSTSHSVHTLVKGRAMKRWIFFTLHFALGFVMLWFLHKLAQFSFLPLGRAPLWSQALVDTLYLVAGVIWGNVGWDAFKRFPKDASWSLFIYVLSRTLVPVLVALPLAIFILSLFFQTHYLSWRATVTWQNSVLLGSAILVLVLQRLYRRSEEGFFHKAWGD